MCEKCIRHITLREKSVQSNVQKQAGRSRAEAFISAGRRDGIKGNSSLLCGRFMRKYLCLPWFYRTPPQRLIVPSLLEILRLLPLFLKRSPSHPITTRLQGLCGQTFSMCRRPLRLSFHLWASAHAGPPTERAPGTRPHSGPLRAADSCSSFGSLLHSHSWKPPSTSLWPGPWPPHPLPGETLRSCS